MLHYDGPPYSYTTSIPPGTRALRATLDAATGVQRTEVVRDRARCDAAPSEHCECRAIDVFTADRATRRRIFEATIDVAETLGVQSVIADRRVWGYGTWHERAYSGADPHTGHVHIGINRAAARELTPIRVAAVLAPRLRITTGGTTAMTPEQLVAAAVWEHPLTNLMDGAPKPAHNILEWAHLDANTALAIARDLTRQIARLDARIARLEAGQ